MPNSGQSVGLAKLGKDDCVTVIKNTFVHIQSVAESPKRSSRNRSFTDFHCDYKSNAMPLVPLSFCETEEGSNAESESDTDSRNSDGSKCNDIRPSDTVETSCVLGTSRELVTPLPEKSAQRNCRQQPLISHPVIQVENYTTVMLRNLPNNYTREMLVELLELQGFAKRFDFLYVPMDFSKRAGLGYAFVNFLSNEDGTRAMQMLENFDDWKVPSQKVLHLSWSLPLQGLAANIERYRNSAVMHPEVPEEFKPIILENGFRVSFPSPTRNIALGIRSKTVETPIEEPPQPKPRKVQQRITASPGCPEEEYTTVMLRNLPNDYTREMLIELLHCAGFRGRFDFLYLPRDFERGSGLGYAFVNFVHHEDALLAMKKLAKFDDWTVPSTKVLELTWSLPLQGLAANIERYRNNSVMHFEVPERFKPLVFKDGYPTWFPAPTRNVHPPHRRR